MDRALTEVGRRAEPTGCPDMLSHNENLRQPFRRKPDFGATGVLYNFADLLERAGQPS